MIVCVRIAIVTCIYSQSCFNDIQKTMIVFPTRNFHSLSKDKFQAHSRPCVFIGYPFGKKGWHFSDPHEDKLLFPGMPFLMKIYFPFHKNHHRLFPSNFLPISNFGHTLASSHSCSPGKVTIPTEGRARPKRRFFLHLLYLRNQALSLSQQLLLIRPMSQLSPPRHLISKLRTRSFLHILGCAF